MDASSWIARTFVKKRFAPYVYRLHLTVQSKGQNFHREASLLYPWSLHLLGRILRSTLQGGLTRILSFDWYNVGCALSLWLHLGVLDIGVNARDFTRRLHLGLLGIGVKAQDFAGADSYVYSRVSDSQSRPFRSIIYTIDINAGMVSIEYS